MIFEGTILFCSALTVVQPHQSYTQHTLAYGYHMLEIIVCCIHYQSSAHQKLNYSCRVAPNMRTRPFSETNACRSLPMKCIETLVKMIPGQNRALQPTKAS